MPQTVSGRCLDHTTVFCHVVFIPSGLVWEKLRLGYLLTNKLSEEPVGGGWKIGLLAPPMESWLETDVHLVTNSQLCIIDYWHSSFSNKTSPLPLFLLWGTNLKRQERFSDTRQKMNCANHYDDSECKDRRHTSMIAGSIEDTWRQIADRRGLLGSQPKR